MTTKKSIYVILNLLTLQIGSKPHDLSKTTEMPSTFQTISPCGMNIWVARQNIQVACSFCVDCGTNSAVYWIQSAYQVSCFLDNDEEKRSKNWAAAMRKQESERRGLHTRVAVIFIHQHGLKIQKCSWIMPVDLSWT